MDNNEIKLRLKEEIESATPDVLDKILDGVKNENHTATVIAFKKKKAFPIKAVSSIAAAICVILLGAYIILGNSSPTFKLELDVNPGILLSVDKNETVKDVTLLNEDAKKLVGDMKLKGSDMEVAIHAIMYSVIEHGYIDEMTNSVLVTLDDSDGIATKEITDKISQSVYSPFENGGLQGSVLIHSVDLDNELYEIAEEYGITVGKAGLVKHLVESKNTVYTYEQLSKLSINELNILLNEIGALEHVTVFGEASRKAYIGEEKACNTAYSAFGATSGDIKPIDCILELDNGVMVYEVEFILNGAIYECEVDAITGELKECDMELAKDNQGGFEIPTEPATTPTSSPSYAKPTEETTTEKVEETATEAPVTTSAKQEETSKREDFIGPEKAKEIAFSHLGITQSDAIHPKVEFDFHGAIVYSVEFFYAGNEYEFEIDALTGKIIEFEKDD